MRINRLDGPGRGRSRGCGFFATVVLCSAAFAAIAQDAPNRRNGDKLQVVAGRNRDRVLGDVVQ